MDLVLCALANCTQSSVSIVYVHDNCIKKFETTPGREGVVSQRSVTLARIGEHYEAVTTSRYCSTQIHKSLAKNDIPVIVSQILTAHQRKLVYKALHGAAPSYIKDLISYHTSQRLLRSSSQHLLATPKANLKTYTEKERLLWRPQDCRTRFH